MSDPTPARPAGARDSQAAKGSKVPGWLVVAAWCAVVALGYFGVGGFVAQLIEGQDPLLVSPTPIYVALLVLPAALLASVLWARGRVDAGGASLPGRRRFLLGAGAVVGGVAAAAAAVMGRNRGWMLVTGPALAPGPPTLADAPRAEWAGARVREYRRLGRTGFDVSDISLGSGHIRGEKGEQLARMAIERGINYFDTAPDYSAEGSELALGRAIQGHRPEMFVATKFCTPGGNLPAGTSVAHYVEAVEGSLRRLQTDYVDLVHVHACDTLERLLDPNVHEAFDRLKQQGKARFMGFSSHTPNLEAVAAAAIESGRFDVMMLAYHHGAWPKLPELIDRAHADDMGVVAMKTLKGAYHENLLEDRAQADSYTQAAFKWVLGNPSVSCLVISFSEFAHLDEYLYASGRRPAAGDHALLRRYDERIAGIHCRPHCGACLDSCPEGLPIADVLRHRMYFESYGDEKEAMRLYAGLEKQADVCVSCTAPCTGSCPFGIEIQERTMGAHRLLTLPEPLAPV